MPGKTDTNSTPADTSRFATTHWSVVLAAGDHSSSQHEKALSKLCRSYWLPLYVYLRRRGYTIHQAEDYTQGFFVHLLKKPRLYRASPQRGKFRSFLLVSLKHFVADQQDRAQAQKRGGNCVITSLDFEGAECLYDHEVAHSLSPEKLFERSWALAVLRRTMDRLKCEPVTGSKQALFDRLKVYLAAERGAIPYKSLAADLDMTEPALRVAMHRLRQRYHELMREEIAQTVTTDEQVDEEIRDLFAALTN
jgi:RNA polymerase sigma-70 factor (ECF subfamily)